MVREGLAFSLASYTFQLISVVRGFVIAWFLGPALYGVWNIVKTFLETGQYITAGSGQAVTRELPYNKAQGATALNARMCSATLGLLLALASAVAVLALLLAQLEAAAPYRNVIYIAALVFVLNAVHLYIPQQLKGEKKILLLSAYYIAYAVLNLVVGLLLMWQWGIAGLLLGMGLANLVLLAWLGRRGDLVIRPRLDPVTSRRLMQIGFPILFVAVAPRLMASIDKLIVFWLLDPAATGYYSMAAFLTESINYIPVALATVLFPRLMYQKGKGTDLTRMGYLYDKPMVLLAWTMPLLLGLLFLNLGLLIRYLLPAYLPAVPVLQILVVGMFFTVIWSVPRGLLVVFDRQHIFLKAIPVFLLLGALLNVAVIRMGYGIVGVAFASVLFYFVVSLAANLYALGVLQRSLGARLRSLADIYGPFGYGLLALAIVYGVLPGADDLRTCAVRSALFTVLCLPLLLCAEFRLKLVATLRQGLSRQSA